MGRHLLSELLDELLVDTRTEEQKRRDKLRQKVVNTFWLVIAVLLILDGPILILMMYL